MKTTLRGKFIFFSTVLITLMMVIITYLFTIRELANKRRAVEWQIRRIAQNIATTQLLDRQDWSVYQNYISQLMAINDDIIYIAIYDDRNSLRAHALNRNLVEMDQPVYSQRAVAEVVKQLDGGGVAEESQGDLRSERINILIGDRVLGSVHVGFSVIDINRDLRNGILLNVLLGFIFIFGAVIAAVLISRRLTRPLEDLNKAMQALDEGNFSSCDEPATHDEIADLTRSFNDMVEGLQERQIIENLGYELSASFQFDRLALLVRDRLSNAIGAADARMYIRDSDENGLFKEITVPENQQSIFPPLLLNPQIVGFLQQQRNGFMILSAPEPVLQALKHDNRSEDGLVVPMTVNDELFGLLFFELPKESENYSKKQIHFAATLAGQAALALENALLYDKLRKQERMKRELEIARDVQQKLLPAKMPEIPGFQFDGVCLSAQEVGGDYFDFFHLANGNIGIAIADVSGHGASASFYMAEIKGMMLYMTTIFDSPRHLLIELNKKLYQNLERRIFVTMTYGILNPAQNRLIFARAGHNPLLKICAAGQHRFFTPPGIGLGLDAGERFERQLEEIQLDLNHNDTLLFYTDGLVETMNPDNDLFGEQQLLKSLNSVHQHSLMDVRISILNALKKFMNGAQQQDDITMVLLRSVTKSK